MDQEEKNIRTTDGEDQLKELRIREAVAKIEKIEAETDLVNEEKKNVKWKTWAPVIGSVAGVALCLIGEKIGHLIITGKAFNRVMKP